MKKSLMTALFIAAALTGPANANETEEFCISFATQFELGTQPCSCSGEVGEADAGVKAQILALTHPDETDAWDEATKEAVSVCFPENG